MESGSCKCVCEKKGKKNVVLLVGVPRMREVRMERLYKEIVFFYLERCGSFKKDIKKQMISVEGRKG
jgi:hypothetical protein